MRELIESLELLTKSYLFESQTVMDDYFRGKLSLDDLEKKVGLDKIATKKDLEMFLRNKTMQNWKADETGIKVSQIVSKVKELLKRY